jgi:hypothetical protein
MRRSTRRQPSDWGPDVAPLLIPLLLTVILLLGSSPGGVAATYAPVPIENATWTFMSSINSNSEVFSLNAASVAPEQLEDYLLYVALNVSTPALGSYQATVATTDFWEVGSVVMEPDFNHTVMGAIFCLPDSLDANLTVSGYVITTLHPVALAALGQPPIDYQLLVALVQRGLTLGVPQLDSTPVTLSYWFVDISAAAIAAAAAPLEVTVRAEASQSSGRPKTLLLFYGCPGGLSTGADFPPEITATFYNQVRMTISQGDQSLRPGRWYIGIVKNRTDVVSVTAAWGMPYHDYDSRYGITALVFLLVCPAICAITLLLVWSAQPNGVQFWLPVVYERLLPALGLAPDLPPPFRDADDASTSTSTSESQYLLDPSIKRHSSSSFPNTTPHNDISVVVATTTRTTATSTISPTTSGTAHPPNEEGQGEGEDEDEDDPNNFLPPATEADPAAVHADVAAAEAKQTHSHFVQLAIVVMLIFFTPAIQILMGEMLFQSETGDRDVCYYNDFCERPVYVGGLLIFAFNNVYSNIGYIVASLVMLAYLLLLNKYLRHFPKFMPEAYSILWAMCFCLFSIGVDSGIYHLCPSRVGFQVDSAMMLGFALLSLADIWRRYFSPALHSWWIYFWLGVLLLLNYIGTIIDTYPTIADREAPKYIFRGTLTLAVFLFLAAFICWRVLYHPRRKRLKTHIMLALLFALPIMGLLWWNVDSDLSQTLLAIFIVLYAISVAADFAAQLGVDRLIEHGTLPAVCRWCPEGRASCCRDQVLRRIATGLLLTWLLVGWLCCAIVSVYYFSLVDDTNKDLSPALSRNLNQPCVIADYYSSHDVWHFASAWWLQFQLLINTHIGQALKHSRPFHF